VSCHHPPGDLTRVNFTSAYRRPSSARRAWQAGEPAASLSVTRGEPRPTHGLPYLAVPWGSPRKERDSSTVTEAAIDTSIREAVGDAVDFVIPIVELMGAAVIVLGVVIAFTTYALSELRVRPVAYEHVRLLLGRFLAVGLEFQLASDILGTAVSPTFDEIGILGAIAGIRTALNYFLAREIEKAQEMEKKGMLMMPGGRMK
jgi:uncharacterized membrane protein